MKTIICAHCKDEVLKNPRCKTQEYCGKPDCQRARKNKWQQQKMQNDSSYRLNQQACLKSWRKEHKGYWKEYRQKNHKQAERNRILQRVRNKGLSRRSYRPQSGDETKKIAKMDTLDVNNPKLSGTFWLVPKIAKMDTLLVFVTEITNEQDKCIDKPALLQKRTR